MLLAAIDENHKGTYDFLYLPIDFKVIFYLSACSQFVLLLFLSSLQVTVCLTFGCRINAMLAMLLSTCYLLRTLSHFTRFILYLALKSCLWFSFLLMNVVQCLIDDLYLIHLGSEDPSGLVIIFTWVKSNM